MSDGSNSLWLGGFSNVALSSFFNYLCSKCSHSGSKSETYHSRCPTVNVRVAEHDVVAIGTIIAICSGTYTVLLSAFVLVTQILYKPILVDVTRESCGVYPFLQEPMSCRRCINGNNQILVTFLFFSFVTDSSISFSLSFAEGTSTTVIWIVMSFSLRDLDIIRS